MSVKASLVEVRLVAGREGARVGGLSVALLVNLHFVLRRVHRLIVTALKATAKLATLVVLLNVIAQVTVVIPTCRTATTLPAARIASVHFRNVTHQITAVGKEGVC